MIACVLIQALFKADQKVAHLFDGKDWALAPTPGMSRVAAPLSKWKTGAKMTRQERVESYRRFHDGQPGD